MRGRHHPDPRDQSPPQTDLASDRQRLAILRAATTVRMPERDEGIVRPPEWSLRRLTANEKRTYELLLQGRTGARSVVCDIQTGQQP